jgi:hypothetical protein
MKNCRAWILRITLAFVLAVPVLIVAHIAAKHSSLSERYGARIEPGMSMAEVEIVMGRPDDIENHRYRIYGNGFIDERVGKRARWSMDDAEVEVLFNEHGRAYSVNCVDKRRKVNDGATPRTSGR